ncbi:MAG: hypothetical protein ACI9Y1_001247 [Lentisphaeria bacterium]|jgi:hypothetical protein
MFSSEDYLWGWLYYLLGAAMFICCWWYVTAHIRRVEIRHMARVVFVTVLLVPWYTDSQSSQMSPAWLISAIEGVFVGSDAFWRAGRPLLVAVIASLLCSLTFYAVQRYKTQKTA